MRILVTGASGFIGQHLVASLRRDGKSVTVLGRGGAPSTDADRFAGPAELAAIDAMPAWPKDIETIVHLAALNPSRREPATPDALHHANVAGTAALARRAAREGVRRMILVSTANVHGPGPSPIRESDVLAPQSPYARSKAEAETAFRRELEGSATQGCVLRPAPVYGRGGRGNVAALVRLARLPLPLPIEGLGGTRSLLAVDHLTAAIARCLDAEGAAGETFLLADDGALSPAAIVRALRRGWGRPGRVASLPAGLHGLIRMKLGDRGPMRDFRLDTRHLADRLGWRPPATTEARLTEMAASGNL